jgi:hypothetical protein
VVSIYLVQRLASAARGLIARPLEALVGKFFAAVHAIVVALFFYAKIQVLVRMTY